MAKTYNIKLMPLDETFSIPVGKDVYSGLKEHGIFLKSKCGGCASCTDCVIQVLNGEEYMGEAPFEEKRLLGNTFHITKERLSCQLKPSGSMTIDVRQHLDHIEKNRVHIQKTVRRKAEEKIIPEKKERKPKEAGFKKPKAFRYNK